MKNKKMMFIFIVVMVLVAVLLRLSCREMKIIAVHQDDTYSEILVKDYPLTSKGKIDWWLKNKKMLKGKYNIPRPGEDGRYHVVLWDFGDGYKEGDGYDSLCFDNMSPPVNCIDKNKLMIISHSKDNVTEFTVGNKYYILQDDGVSVKVSPD